MTLQVAALAVVATNATDVVIPGAARVAPATN